MLLGVEGAFRVLSVCECFENTHITQNTHNTQSTPKSLRIFEQNRPDDVEGGDDGVQRGHHALQADVVERRHHGVTRQDRHLDEAHPDVRPLRAA